MTTERTTQPCAKFSDSPSTSRSCQVSRSEASATGPRDHEPAAGPIGLFDDLKPFRIAGRRKTLTEKPRRTLFEPFLIADLLHRSTESLAAPGSRLLLSLGRKS